MHDAESAPPGGLPSEVPMLHHVRALPRPLPVPVAGTVVSLTAHAALVGALVVGGTGTGVEATDDATVTQLVRVGAGQGGERLHWVGIAEGPGSGLARAGERPPSAYVVPGREGARRGAIGGGAGGRPAAGDALAGVIPPEAPVTARPSPPPIPDFVLPDVTAVEAATVLVAGVLTSAPDPSRGVSRPEDFTRLNAQEMLPDLLGVGGAPALTPAFAHAQVDVLPIPLVSNPLPSYPRALERSRTGGRVVVEFRIDSTGVVDLASLHVVQSTDSLFTNAVRGVLPSLRFVPAQLRTHAVGLTVRQPFVFRVARY
ncbi:TonB family protein [Roseisolibacter agri]|uniref:TonB family protein n=1 Tax=Roseisolibacter agri TaxID=2014610 RepID=UPI0024E050AA|nr:TonB family protein [Roseisolibacter agri]